MWRSARPGHIAGLALPGSSPVRSANVPAFPTVDWRSLVQVRPQQLVQCAQSGNLRQILKDSRKNPGRALLFQHRVLHEATEMVGGEKLVLRTDVFNRRTTS